MKLCVDDLLPIIYRFLINSGFIKAAKAIQKVVEQDLSDAKCPFHKKKLMNVIKIYLKNKEELLTPYEDENENVEEPLVVEEETTNIVEKKKKKKNKKLKANGENVTTPRESEPTSAILLGKRKRRTSSAAKINTVEEEEVLKP